MSFRLNSKVSGASKDDANSDDEDDLNGGIGGGGGDDHPLHHHPGLHPTSTSTTAKDSLQPSTAATAARRNSYCRYQEVMGDGLGGGGGGVGGETAVSQPVSNPFLAPTTLGTTNVGGNTPLARSPLPSPDKSKTPETEEMTR